MRSSSTATNALDYCSKLYATEKIIKDESPKNRMKERQKQTKSLLDALFAWTKMLRNIAPKIKLDKAVYYLQKNIHICATRSAGWR